MIEFIATDRCTQCNVCVRVCPGNVFDAVPDSFPVIARQADCQTCYMCELYCRTDALYVGSDCEQSECPDPGVVIASGLMGQFRRDHGWDEWAQDPRYRNQHWYMGEVFRRARTKGPP